MPRIKTTTKRAPAKERTAALKKPTGSRKRGSKDNDPTARRPGGQRRPARDSTASIEPDEQPKGLRKKAEAKKRLGGLRLEKRLPLHHRVTALIEAAYPGKRRASSAWDDQIIRRHRTPSMVRLPWEAESETRLNRHKQEIEKPRYILHDLLNSGDFDDSPAHVGRTAVTQARNTDGDPVAAPSFLVRLPAEIRDMILRDLLLHHKDIRVLRGWSLLYPRSRPNLGATILRVCRAFYRQGVRILYGENTFVYVTRDPYAWKTDTEMVVRHVYDGHHVPIDKYGHLFRRIKIVVEANRMRMHESRVALPSALQKFLPGQGGLGAPARLHTITIELPAQTRGEMNMKRDTGTRSSDVPACSWFRRDSPVLNALENLDCQFIRILAFTRQREYFEVLIDRRPHFSQLSADERNFDAWSADPIALANRRGEASRSRARLSTMYHWLEQLAGGLDDRDRTHAILEGPFRHYVPRPSFDDPLEALPSGSSGESSRRSTQRYINYRIRHPFDDTDNEDSAAYTNSSDDGSDNEGGNDEGDGSPFIGGHHGGPDKFIDSQILAHA